MATRKTKSRAPSALCRSCKSRGGGGNGDDGAAFLAPLRRSRRRRHFRQERENPRQRLLSSRRRCLPRSSPSPTRRRGIEPRSLKRRARGRARLCRASWKGERRRRRRRFLCCSRFRFRRRRRRRCRRFLLSISWPNPLRSEAPRENSPALSLCRSAARRRAAMRRFLLFVGFLLGVRGRLRRNRKLALFPNSTHRPRQTDGRRSIWRGRGGWRTPRSSSGRAKKFRRCCRRLPFPCLPLLCRRRRACRRRGRG